MGQTAAATVVADVGGTNTRVALAEGGQVRAGSIRRFTNASAEGLEAILASYLAEAGLDAPAGACVALAGPVQGDRAQMTNLGWHVTCDSLAQATGTGRVVLLNDLQAQGHALDYLDPACLLTLRHGAPSERDAARLVVGLGTGMNAAPVHRTPGGIFVPPSESGHVHLPQHGPGESQLARWLETNHGFASVEDVLSGRGVERLWQWHSLQAGQESHRSAAQIMQALEAGDPIAQAVARSVIHSTARVLASLALIHLPLGGIFLIGGVARAFAPWVNRFGFEEAFCEMGRFSDFVRDFPVHVVEDDFAALTGCASCLHAVLNADSPPR